jgi:hypothetical protein
LLVILVAATVLTGCGESEEAKSPGWSGPDETFGVNLKKDTDPAVMTERGPDFPEHGFTQWGWGEVSQNGQKVGRAWVDCKRLAKVQWLCSAILHLKQGTVIALDATPFYDGVANLRTISGTGRYRNPDGWLSISYFPSTEAKYGFTWQLCHRLSQYPRGKFC